MQAQETRHTGNSTRIRACRLHLEWSSQKLWSASDQYQRIGCCSARDAKLCQRGELVISSIWSRPHQQILSTLWSRQQTTWPSSTCLKLERVLGLQPRRCHSTLAWTKTREVSQVLHWAVKLRRAQFKPVTAKQVMIHYGREQWK